jgi:hypothetical protein
MEIQLSQTDLQNAETFLTQYMSEKVPSASFEEGSAVRDFAIKAFAYLFAYLRGEIDLSRTLQSLQKIKEYLAEKDETLDTAQATDELMSNWFISRNQGFKTQMTAQMHFTEKAAIIVRRDTKFWRTNTLAFYPNIDGDSIIISQNQLRPVFDVRGRLIDYIGDIPLVASRPGLVYDFDPGRFVRVEAAGGIPYFSYAEHQEAARGGGNLESSQELIDRADTAISVRNLINNRSCDVVLQNNFSDVTDTLTVGMGETEMVRDKRTEVARHMQLHIGGCYDTYLGLPLTRVEENGTVGGFFPRPDNIVNTFRDPKLTYDLGNTFTSLGIQVGHILYIRSGIIGAPRGFQIIRVEDHSLYVSEAAPFPEASDELDLNTVVYSIGWLSPSFNEINFDPLGSEYIRTSQISSDPAYSYITCGTSRRIGIPGAIMLSGRPIQELINVELTNPDSGGSYNKFIDPSTGTVKFPYRVNTSPIEGSVLGTSQFQLDVLNPEKSQSAEAVNFIKVGYLTDLSVFDGKNLRVVYQSLSNFTAIHNYVKNYNVRVQAANHLLRGRHPIWISLELPFRYKPTASEVINETEAKQILSDHINNFDPNDNLDMSDLATVFRNNFSMVGTVFPFMIYYSLYMPDGQVLQFVTSDIVSIFMSDTNGVAIENSGDLVVPAELIDAGITSIFQAQHLRDWYALMGISDRTVVYRSSPSLISFVLRG